MFIVSIRLKKISGELKKKAKSHIEIKLTIEPQEFNRLFFWLILVEHTILRYLLILTLSLIKL